jgi:hypothetical protein
VTSNPPLSGLLYSQPVEVDTLEPSFFFLKIQDVKSKTEIKIIGKALNLYITPLVLSLLRQTNITIIN